MAKHIPNIITCCNLVSGCIAITLALSGCSALVVLVWIMIGAGFDFFDGMSARLLNVSSPVGKELDSLADIVTFGVAPASLVFTELYVVEYPTGMDSLRSFLPFVAYIMVAFSALRLAKFNLDTRQTTSFIGLPTPANALFWGSLIAGAPHLIESSAWVLPILLVLIGVSSWLMVAEIPMFALKFKHWGWAENKIRYSFIIFSVIMIALLQIAAFTVIIPCYIIISILINHKDNKHGNVS